MLGWVDQAVFGICQIGWLEKTRFRIRLELGHVIGGEARFEIAPFL